jgi:threonine synthase
MRFVSTRGEAPAVGLSQAITLGLASDGGLYVPEEFPGLPADELREPLDLPELAERVLRPLFRGDALEPYLTDICRAALDLPLPLKPLPRDTAVLELYHGPSAAFKDFGARFLAQCLRCIDRAEQPGAGEREPRTVLVATSGDTGSAVAAAFHGRPGAEVIVLYPDGGVSARQQHLLTCWGDNVRSFAVRGGFDECQALAKAAFRDEELRVRRRLTSANSINIGRLLPQAVYYVAASVWYEARVGEAAGFIVPSGNLGNAVGALWAARLGFPVRHVALATNANRVVADWLEGGPWWPRPAVPTLANAMDVGSPSNIERIWQLYPEPEQLRRIASVVSVDDDAIREEIRRGPSRWGEVWCPHTATAVHLRERLSSPHWVIAATAHPAKFDSVVEPLIGRAVEVPPQLRGLLSRPSRFEVIDADLEELRRRLAV